MIETKDEIRFNFELPDFSREEIDVKIEDDLISIFAESKKEKNVDEKNLKSFEKSERTFSYSASLPKIKKDEAKIDFESGVLRVVIPKKF
jgi:HSP20 family protein